MTNPVIKMPAATMPESYLPLLADVESSALSLPRLRHNLEPPIT